MHPGLLGVIALGAESTFLTGDSVLLQPLGLCNSFTAQLQHKAFAILLIPILSQDCFQHAPIYRSLPVKSVDVQIG